MNTFPKQIQKIQQFLNSCKYEQITSGKDLFYRSPQRIEKEKKCICFDGALYAKFQVDNLINQNILDRSIIQTKILSIFGIKIENNQKTTKAHSVCLIKYKEKFGCIGMSSSKDMMYYEPNYNSIEQLVLEFSKPFFNRQIWLTHYKIENEKNFHLLIENPQNQYTQNQIFSQSESHFLKEITIAQYLSEIKNIDLEQISNLLESIKYN